VFTPDARIHYAVERGAELSFRELVPWLARALAIFKATQHVITNPLVELAGDAARSTSYLTGTHVQVRVDGEEVLTTEGSVYTDQLVRSPEGWRIAARKLERIWVDGTYLGPDEVQLFPSVTARACCDCDASVFGAPKRSPSAFLFEAQHSGLIDAGLFQGRKELRLRNWAPFPIEPRELSAVVLTHAHIDHSGFLPRLVRDGFAAQCAAPGTVDLLTACCATPRVPGRTRNANRYGYTNTTPAPLYTLEDERTLSARAAHHPAPVPRRRRRAREAPRDILGASTVILVGEVAAAPGLPGDLGRRGRPSRDPGASQADVLR
jgi:hypothetical protein